MLRNKKTSWITLTIIVLWSVYLGVRIADLSDYNHRISYVSLKTEKAQKRGVASYYDYILDSGWSSVGHFVCATRDFERYSYVKAINIDNGKEVVCYVTDYGPNEIIHPDRIIDLSSTAFKVLAPLNLGVVNVIVKQL